MHTWLAIFTLVCQIAFPFGHNSLAEELGEECPGLELFDGPTHGGERSDGVRAASDDAAAHHHDACAVCQSIRSFAGVTAAEPPVLQLPTEHARAPAIRISDGIATTDDAFSRPQPRAPPALL